MLDQESTERNDTMVVDGVPQDVEMLDTSTEAQERLAAYLSDLTGRTLSGQLGVRLIAGGRSNPTYEVQFNDEAFVLRRPPHGHVLPTAHDMGREYRVIKALEHTDVPVPRAYALCNDKGVIGAPFFLMEKLDGVTLRTREQSQQLSPAQRATFGASMVDTLVRLHSVDPSDVGLESWGRPEGFLDRQLDRWKKQWDASQTQERPQVEQVLRALTRSVPRSHFPGIVHGDYKTDNLMVHPVQRGHILGLLDWEMSTLGDTVADLGVMLSFWDQQGESFNPVTAGVTALPGFPSRDEIFELYVSSRGVEIPDIDWYVAFADFKIAVIMEGILSRHLQGKTVGEGLDSVAGMIAPLLDRAVERVASSPTFSNRL